VSSLTRNDLLRTIPERFAQVVAESSQAIAIRFEAQSLAYAELDHRARCVSNFLVDEMGGRQAPVAVLHSSQKAIVPLLLGIVNSGHMYSAVSAGDPAARISEVLKDLAAPLLVVADDRLLTLAREVCPPQTRLIMAEDVHREKGGRPRVDLTPESLAVITYTSGSTGEPKGVLRTHKMILHQAWTYSEQFAMQGDSRMLGTRPYSASSSLSELFVPLLNGSSIVPFDLKEDGLGQLRQVLKSQEVTMMRPPIQALRSFLDSLPAEELFPTLRYVFATGDVFYRRDVERLRKVIPEDAIIVHQYAMSEAGILAVNQISRAAVLDSEVVPAGRPVKGKELVVLDENGHELPHGEVGEVFVRTTLSFPGYWRAPEQTAERFRPDPQDGQRALFATGDLGRIRPDGQLEHTGRKDWRVKILGYSVDLSAIEHVLMTSPAVQRAVVVALTDPTGQKRLVAYVVSKPDAAPFASRELSDLVAGHLPAYMVPSLIVPVADIPIGAAGKVDRKALPVPDWQSPEVSTLYEAPGDETQAQLAAIWKRILKVRQVGVGDNFFELGGDSLMALEMTLEVERAFARTVPQQFFKNPTISALSGLLSAGQRAEPVQDKFVLESYMQKSGQDKWSRKRKSAKRRPGRRAAGTGSPVGFDRFTDPLVARYIVTLPYLEAREWSVRWVRNRLVRELLYRGRQSYLSRLMSELEDSRSITPEVFQMSIITNLSYGLSRYYDKSKRESLGRRGAFRTSPFRYWKSLADLIEHSPEQQVLEYFPINGMEHFKAARGEGRGVIFLTAHSISSPIRLHALSRLINAEIPTISYRVPIRQSEYHETPKDLPDSVGQTMNAEIALFGQRQLQQGRAINIAADTSDPYGHAFDISLGGRAYRIKSGFAELALNTGARIIPHFGGCLVDGRPELNLLPALEPGDGSRARQIENLVHQYANFVTHVWAHRPEVLHWRRISDHYLRPALDGE
jgi:amino acid adenylation domain-containing protein